MRFAGTAGRPARRFTVKSADMRHRFSAAIGLTLLAGALATADTPSGTPSSDAISAARVRADVEFLADDLLEGREAGTRGYDLAALYAVAQLKASGFEPAADDGSYLQQVPFIESTPVERSLRISAGGRETELAVPDDALVPPSVWQEQVEVTAPLVFAGFGVTAPELKYDDYAGLDVKGRIVVVLYNAPASFPSEPRAHYASMDQKIANAAGRGAVGIVVALTDGDAARYPWERVIAHAGKPALAWVKPDGTPGKGDSRIRAQGLVSPKSAAKLFAAASTSFEDVVAAAGRGAVKGFDLNATATIRSRSTHRRITSPNVLAKLPGGDPALAKTSVVLTAHLDHTGVSPDGDGDRINNGAYDNALGSAILLEVARALGDAPRPKRSVVVALVTAEEKGLLGSDYLAQHLPKAAGTVVANVNLDMPVLLAPSRDVVAFGAENSSLEAVVERAAGEAGYAVSPDPMPEQNIFVRSDQYSFVKQGVPAVYLMPGFTAIDPDVNGAQVFGGFLARHYHQPSDDLSLPMDLDAIGRFTHVNLLIARAIADSPETPAWKPGNFFGETFGK